MAQGNRQVSYSHNHFAVSQGVLGWYTVVEAVCLRAEVASFTAFFGFLALEGFVAPDAFCSVEDWIYMSGTCFALSNAIPKLSVFDSKTISFSRGTINGPAGSATRSHYAFRIQKEDAL